MGLIKFISNDRNPISVINNEQLYTESCVAKVTRFPVTATFSHGKYFTRSIAYCFRNSDIFTRIRFQGARDVTWSRAPPRYLERKIDINCCSCYSFTLLPVQSVVARRRAEQTFVGHPLVPSHPRGAALDVRAVLSDLLYAMYMYVYVCTPSLVARDTRATAKNGRKAFALVTTRW